MIAFVTSALLWGSAIGCGLMAGVYFAFSTFVMTSLGRLAPPAGAAAMCLARVAPTSGALRITARFPTLPIEPARLIGASWVTLACFNCPLLEWTTTSPPITGRPAWKRSKRTCSVPSGSTITSRTWNWSPSVGAPACGPANFNVRAVPPAARLKADGFCWISCSALSTAAGWSPAWAKALRLARVIAVMGSSRDSFFM